MNQYIANSGIYTIDAHYVQPKLVAIHLIRSEDRIAIVDTGTFHSVSQVEKALHELDLNYSHVDYVILTHIHLDHAGGAGKLMQLCENAQLIVHPKGARHMSEPQRLIDGTIAVYGEEKFKEFYGEIIPVDKSRVIEPKDSETIELAGRALTFLDSPGHANHHHCILDSQTNSVFTGDTLGVCYQALRNGDDAYLLLSTTPVQFNPDAMHASIDKIMSYKPDCLYLTHYSAIKPSATMIAGLHEQIEDFVLMTKHCANDDDRLFEKTLEQEILNYTVQRCQNLLPEIDNEVIRKWVSLDIKLNVQGLVFWWNHKRE